MTYELDARKIQELIARGGHESLQAHLLDALSNNSTDAFGEILAIFTSQDYFSKYHASYRGKQVFLSEVMSKVAQYDSLAFLFRLLDYFHSVGAVYECGDLVSRVANYHDDTLDRFEECLDYCEKNDIHLSCNPEKLEDDSFQFEETFLYIIANNVTEYARDARFLQKTVAYFKQIEQDIDLSAPWLHRKAEFATVEIKAASPVVVNNSVTNIRNFCQRFKVQLHENIIKMGERFDFLIGPMTLEAQRAYSDFSRSFEVASVVFRSASQPVLSIQLVHAQNEWALSQVFSDTEVAVSVDVEEMLAIAAMLGHRSGIETLFEKSGNINWRWRDCAGNTLLHFFAIGGCKDDVRDISEDVSGDLFQAKNFNGDTALHHAAWFDNADMATTLKALGSKLDVKNKQGRMPLHLALESGGTDVLLSPAMFAASANFEACGSGAPEDCRETTLGLMKWFQTKYVQLQETRNVLPLSAIFNKIKSFNAEKAVGVTEYSKANAKLIKHYFDILAYQINLTIYTGSLLEALGGEHEYRGLLGLVFDYGKFHLADVLFFDLLGSEPLVACRLSDETLKDSYQEKLGGSLDKFLEKFHKKLKVERDYFGVNDIPCSPENIIDACQQWKTKSVSSRDNDEVKYTLDLIIHQAKILQRYCFHLAVLKDKESQSSFELCDHIVEQMRSEIDRSRQQNLLQAYCQEIKRNASYSRVLPENFGHVIGGRRRETWLGFAIRTAGSYTMNKFAVEQLLRTDAMTQAPLKVKEITGVPFVFQFPLIVALFLSSHSRQDYPSDIVSALRGNLTKDERLKQIRHYCQMNGDTVLHVAAQVPGNDAFIVALLDLGADVRAVNANNRTPVQLAIENGCVGNVKTMRQHRAVSPFEFNAAMHYRDNNKRHAGHRIFVGNQVVDSDDLVQLLECGLKLSAPDVCGDSPLMLMVKCGFWEGLRLAYPYLSLGEVQRFYPGNRTLLHVAAANGCVEVVEVLMQDPAKAPSLYARSHEGHQAIHAALNNGKSAVVVALLKRMDPKRIVGLRQMLLASKNNLLEVIVESGAVADLLKVLPVDKDEYDKILSEYKSLRSGYCLQNFAQELNQNDFIFCLRDMAGETLSDPEKLYLAVTAGDVERFKQLWDNSSVRSQANLKQLFFLVAKTDSAEILSALLQEQLVRARESLPAEFGQERDTDAARIIDSPPSDLDDVMPSHHARNQRGQLVLSVAVDHRAMEVMSVLLKAPKYPPYDKISLKNLIEVVDSCAVASRSQILSPVLAATLSSIVKYLVNEIQVLRERNKDKETEVAFKALLHSGDDERKETTRRLVEDWLSSDNVVRRGGVIRVNQDVVNEKVSSTITVLTKPQAYLKLTWIIEGFEGCSAIGPGDEKYQLKQDWLYYLRLFQEALVRHYDSSKLRVEIAEILASAQRSPPASQGGFKGWVRRKAGKAAGKALAQYAFPDLAAQNQFLIMVDSMLWSRGANLEELLIDVLNGDHGGADEVKEFIYKLQYFARYFQLAKDVFGRDLRELPTVVASLGYSSDVFERLAIWLSENSDDSSRLIETFEQQRPYSVTGSSVSGSRGRVESYGLESEGSEPAVTPVEEEFADNTVNAFHPDSPDRESLRKQTRDPESPSRREHDAVRASTLGRSAGMWQAPSSPGRRGLVQSKGKGRGPAPKVLVFDD